MKTKLTLILLIVFSILLPSCEEKEDIKTKETEIDLINNEFPEAQADIKEVLDGIFKSIQEKDADKLISYHVYSPKFTEFRAGEPRFGSEENEQYERGLVDAVSAFDYELGDLRIDVFGDVALVTFNADFRPTIGGDVVQIWEGATLVFVKIDNTWKITHEHFSPLNK